MDIKTLGLDIGKNTFHMIGADQTGTRHLKKKFSRPKLMEFMAHFPTCLVGMESCGGAHHLAREFTKMGYTVKLIAPRYVKPFIDTRYKNDFNDAAAICEAVTRPHMNFVPIKTIKQQDLIAIHIVRDRFVQQRTALVNELRGLLLERGITINKGISNIIPALESLINGENPSITPVFRDLLRDYRNHCLDKNEEVKKYENQLKAIAKKSPEIKRSIEAPGIGLITATLLEGKIADMGTFKNGRQFAAFLGLVPKQYTTGGKIKLGSISKRGDRALRTLLIHGARSVLFALKRRKTPIDSKHAEWFLELEQNVGIHKAIVGYANKTARILWAMQKYGTKYDPNHSPSNKKK